MSYTTEKAGSNRTFMELKLIICFVNVLFVMF